MFPGQLCVILILVHAQEELTCGSEVMSVALQIEAESSVDIRSEEAAVQDNNEAQTKSKTLSEISDIVGLPKPTVSTF